MKTTAQAPANIAFIKYWGKRSDALRLPLNDSISMNLDGAMTTTTVEFSDTQQHHDDVSFIGESVSEKEIMRIVTHLDRIRRLAKKNIFARVITKNSFPKSTGIASSASGFAALTVAATHALELHLTEKELTVIARLGSGSACRSIPDGFSWWHAGKKSGDSYAESIYPSTWWNLCDVLCIVSKEAKKVSTTDGMDGIKTSPYWKARIHGIPEKIQETRLAIERKDIEKLGTLIEEDAISMHNVMMTQTPPLFYWNDATMRVIRELYTLRADGVAAYFTIDAGPNVHIICQNGDKERVYEQVKNIPGIQDVMISAPATGARVIERHLF